MVALAMLFESKFTTEVVADVVKSMVTGGPSGPRLRPNRSDSKIPFASWEESGGGVAEGLWELLKEMDGSGDKLDVTVSV